MAAKMTRVIWADAGGSRIVAELSLTSSRLRDRQFREILKYASRAIADVFRDLPYTDFGVENTFIGQGQK